MQVLHGSQSPAVNWSFMAYKGIGPAVCWCSDIVRSCKVPEDTCITGPASPGKYMPLTGHTLRISWHTLQAFINISLNLAK